jgi:hypothetical protein
MVNVNLSISTKYDKQDQQRWAAFNESSLHTIQQHRTTGKEPNWTQIKTGLGRRQQGWVDY